LAHQVVSVSGKRFYEARDKSPKKLPQRQIAPSQRPARARQARQFAPIRDLPGNLRISQTAWWAREDSNLQPDRYERPALTIELRARTATKHASGRIFIQGCRIRDNCSPATRLACRRGRLHAPRGDRLLIAGCERFRLGTGGE